jgi:hypothetical protein
MKAKALEAIDLLCAARVQDTSLNHAVGSFASGLVRQGHLATFAHWKHHIPWHSALWYCS